MTDIITREEADQKVQQFEQKILGKANEALDEIMFSIDTQIREAAENGYNFCRFNVMDAAIKRINDPFIRGAVVEQLKTLIINRWQSVGFSCYYASDNETLNIGWGH